MIFGTAHAATWTNSITPSQCYAGYVNGSVIISGFEQSQGCSSAAVIFDVDNSNPKDILSMCLTAFVSGKKMLCVVDGCTGTYQKGKQCMLRQE